MLARGADAFKDTPGGRAAAPADVPEAVAPKLEMAKLDMPHEVAVLNSAHVSCVSSTVGLDV